MTHSDIGIADNDGLLELLYPSGCRKIVVGFESIEAKSLKTLEKWKYERLINYGRYIEKIQSYGIGTVSYTHLDVYKRQV